MQNNSGNDSKRLNKLDQWLKKTIGSKSNQNQSQNNQSQNTHQSQQQNHRHGNGPNHQSQSRPNGSNNPNGPGNSNGKPGQFNRSNSKNWHQDNNRDNNNRDKNNRGRRGQHSGNNRGPGRNSFGYRPSKPQSNQSSFVRAQSADLNAPKYDPKGRLRVIPIGGLDEVGKNTMIFEYGEDIILIDMGFQFPEDGMLGVDYVIPDFTYLKDKLHRIKAIVITHGHMDHIGAIPYTLNKLNFPPIYAGKLARGLMEKQLEEHGMLQQAKIHHFDLDDTLQFGQMKLTFFGVTHSIPDCCGVHIDTPAGSVVHTGDFKIDLSPPGDQQPPEFHKISALGHKNVTLLMSDSTNAMKPGFSKSEREIGRTLDKIIASEKGRIIIASFASQIGRMQYIIDAAKKNGRKIFLSGRSLINNFILGEKLGFLNIPDGLVNDIKAIKRTPPHKTIVLTTGSQGEPMAALSRMANKEHAQVKINQGDTVVLSSSPIPGNERSVYSVINKLTMLGAKIIHNLIMDVHASGHGYQEDLKLMFGLVRPKYFAPIHGEYFMRKTHGDVMINSMGLPAQNMIMAENGTVMEIHNGHVNLKKETVETKFILVDGLGGGDIGTHIMQERQQLSENGIVVVSLDVDKNAKKLRREPIIESKGFIYMEETKEILAGLNKIVKSAFDRFATTNPNLPEQELGLHIRRAVDTFIVQKVDRKPLIIPIIN